MAKLAKLSSKNQITLPKDVITRYAGTEYFEVRDTGTGIFLQPMKAVPSSNSTGNLENIRDKIKRLKITKKDIDDAVKWARAKRRAKKEGL